MLAWKNLLSVIAGIIGTAGSAVAVIEYFQPHQPAAEPRETASAAPVAHPVATLQPQAPIDPQNKPVKLPESKQVSVPKPLPTNVPVEAEEPPCHLYSEFDGKRSFTLVAGIEVCDESGRVLASVKSVTVNAFPDYIGVKFSVPGKADVFCWKEAKTCRVPFAPSRTYYIEKLRDTVNGGVATFRSQ